MGTTFGGGPMACAAVEAVIEAIEAESLLANVRQVSAYIRAHCLIGPVTGVQGAGFLLGLKTSRPAKEVQAALLERGILAGTSADPARPALAARLHLERGARRHPARRPVEDPRVKRFFDLADFDRAEILDLLALAQSLHERPPGPVLAGKVLGLVFLNPSLRTLASFQAAMGRLGGTSFVITPGQGTWQLETRPECRHGRRGRRAHPRGHSGARLLSATRSACAPSPKARISRRISTSACSAAIDALCDAAAHQPRIRDEPSLPGARRLAHAR